MASYSDHSFLEGIEVHLGSENLVTPEFLQALEESKVLTLGGSRYLLVEFPLFMPFLLIVSAVDQILEREMIPVLAHVERYEAFHEEPERLDELRNRGCVIQVNAEAFGNEHSNERSELALSLAKSGLVDVIASDGHDLCELLVAAAEVGHLLLVALHFGVAKTNLDVAELLLEALDAVPHVLRHSREARGRGGQPSASQQNSAGLADVGDALRSTVVVAAMIRVRRDQCVAIAPLHRRLFRPISQRGNPQHAHRPADRIGHRRC